MRILLRAFLLSGAVVALASAAVVPAGAQVVAGASQAITKIGPLDRLQVTVFREPDLSVEDVPVDESGRIVLPLVGGIPAAGKSPEALAAEIETKLQYYLRSPQVAVAVKQSAAKKITVAGAVMEPGVFPVEGRTTLLQAVSLARGPSQVAALDKVLIFREVNGQRTAARFNLGAIAKGKAADPIVLPGDTIALGSSGMKTAWRDAVLTLRSFNIFSVIP
jgi:polysaccharide export outer membrane protein